MKLYRYNQYTFEFRRLPFDYDPWIETSPKEKIRLLKEYGKVFDQYLPPKNYASLFKGIYSIGKTFAFLNYRNELELQNDRLDGMIEFIEHNSYSYFNFINTKNTYATVEVDTKQVLRILISDENPFFDQIEQHTVYEPGEVFEYGISKDGLTVITDIGRKKRDEQYCIEAEKTFVPIWDELVKIYGIRKEYPKFFYDLGIV